jgi:uncharacterized protein (DUF1800 family)
VAADAAADRVFLDRLTFGATDESLHRLARLGRAAWLDRQLAPVPDAGLERRLAAMRVVMEYEAGDPDAGETWPAFSAALPLTAETLDGAALVDLVDYHTPRPWEERIRPATEVIAASMLRAVHSEAQLREVMTQFWHEHFNVNSAKDEVTGAFFGRYDATLRRHALGNFRAMLGAVAREPAMLRYLTNDDSRASPANENFARELFELHTMGRDAYLNALFDRWAEVPGAADGQPEGFIDADVYEAARAFTGWTIGDGRRWDDGAEAPRTGDFAFAALWHDPYQKRVLATELAAFPAPMADGEAVLDLVAAHPATARFVTGKILRRFGIEDPSDAYRADIAAIFTESRSARDQIARTIRAAALHPEFDTPPTKLRRPFEFLAAFYRATGAEVSPRDGGLYWHLEQAGWPQHRVRAPTGPSDRTADWADTRTVAGLVNLALVAHADWMQAADDVLRRRPEGVTTWGDLADHWDARLGPGGREVLAALGVDPDWALEGADEGWVNWGVETLVAAAALTPRFLYR